MKTHIHLRPVLLTALSGAFVALLIGFSGDLYRLWPLCGLPVILAAILYGPPGALVVGVLVCAVMALALMGEPSPVPPSSIPAMVVGIAVFVVGGVLVGLALRRRDLDLQKAERTSVVDKLTELYDRDYVVRRLAEELQRAQRYGAKLGLALVDIDDLRTFNDTFGHYKGDVLIRHTGEIIRLTTRDTDVLARYEGGTFATIFPHAGTAETASVAERIRLAIEEADFEGDELEPATKRTVSVGVASFPESAAQPDELFERAAEALHKAKLEGRNRVAVPPGGSGALDSGTDGSAEAGVAAAEASPKPAG